MNNNFLKDIGNGIYLTDQEENILVKYNIDYKNCKNVSELIFKLEQYLNEIDNNELDQLQERLSEFNYYNNTNK